MGQTQECLKNCFVSHLTLDSIRIFDICSLFPCKSRELTRKAAFDWSLGPLLRHPLNTLATRQPLRANAARQGRRRHTLSLDLPLEALTRASASSISRCSISRVMRSVSRFSLQNVNANAQDTMHGRASICISA